MFRKLLLYLLLVYNVVSPFSKRSVEYELIQHRLDSMQENYVESSYRVAKQFTLAYRLLNDILSITNRSSHLLDLHLSHRHPTVESCREADSSGTYTFRPALLNFVPFTVLCDAFDGAGWMVIQQRLNGAVSFNRSWAEYRDGFGTVGQSDEFWLGLERLHRLTDSGRFELVVELKNESGRYGYARYSQFKVAGMGDKYRLLMLGNYFGTIGDELSFHLNRKFSTYDSDSDDWKEGNCASRYGGGWWFLGCAYSILNGPFERSIETGWGILWSKWTNAASYSRMMIRRK